MTWKIKGHAFERAQKWSGVTFFYIVELVLDVTIHDISTTMLIWFGFMVSNATFNNISVISWQSVLFVEDPEKITDMSQVTDKRFHIILHTSP